jgi:Ser/Thr protein kinase RdoA (MazF antagonist)
MSDASHRVHGVGTDEVPPDWPPLQPEEIGTLLARYPDLAGDGLRIAWHSPRPLSAAALVDTAHGRIFIKRHHVSVRTPACLAEEHRFIAHLSAAGLPVVRLHADRDGRTAVALGDWTYEIHGAGIGEDLYRQTTSWTPLTDLSQAREAGAMLARLHQAAADYIAPQRSTHLLVARDDLLRADDPIAVLETQLDERPGLAAYLQSRDWHCDVRKHLLPWHQGLAQRLRAEPRLWGHNDWHVSNLLWQRQHATMRISSVLDFGLASPTSALFDLATAIERNAIAWLTLERGMEAIHVDTALALIAGYRQVLPLDTSRLQLLADLLPLVHVEFALSEVEYFQAITRAPGNADVAYETFLLGHAQWFHTLPGHALLEAVRAAA